MLDGVVLHQGVYAVDTILDRRVGTRHAHLRLETIWIAPKEVLDNLPVGARGRGLPLLTGGVTIHVYVKDPRLILPKHFLEDLAHSLVLRLFERFWRDEPLLGAAEEFFASRQGMGIRQDQLIQDVYPS